MARESRVKKSLLNARVNMICYFISLVITFFSRKIFIDQLGLNFVGLTTTLQSILSFLNLAELGVGSAIAYILYKPLFDSNISKINELISVFGYLYRCIGLFIIGCGIVVSLFLPLIYSETQFSLTIIYFGFYAFLSSSLLGYFVNYKQTLLSADQRNYEITGYYQAVTAIKNIFQIILVNYTKNLYLYLSLEIIFSAIYSLILTWRVKKTYPWLQNDVKLGKKLFKKYPKIGKYVKQIFIHKIGAFTQQQLTPLLIYSYVSLPMVAIYGNYVLISSGILRLTTSFLGSTTAGIGNLISEGNKQKIYDTYKELISVQLFAATFFSCCFYFLSTPFITLLFGKELVLPNIIVFFISIHLFFYLMRGATENFVYGFGMFYDIWAPAAEIVIFVTAATILGNIYGLTGVLCGPVLSLLFIVGIWRPYFLFKKGFKISVTRYWLLFLTDMLPLTISLGITILIYKHWFVTEYLDNNWTNWVIGSAAFALMLAFFSFILLYPVSSGFRQFVHRFVNIIKKRK